MESRVGSPSPDITNGRDRDEVSTLAALAVLAEFQSHAETIGATLAATLAVALTHRNRLLRVHCDEDRSARYGVVSDGRVTPGWILPRATAELSRSANSPAHHVNIAVEPGDLVSRATVSRTGRMLRALQQGPVCASWHSVDVAVGERAGPSGPVHLPLGPEIAGSSLTSTLMWRGPR